MLMRGEMNKVLEDVNKVLDKAFKKIDHLEALVAQQGVLLKAQTTKIEEIDVRTAKKPVGRPKKVQKGVDKAA